MKPALRILLLTPLIGASITLTWLSSIPELVTPDLGFTWQDKFYHLVAYTVYGFTAILASYAVRPSASVAWRGWAVLLVGLTFGAVDELHQSFVPGRDGSIYDWVADAIGIHCALISLPVVQSWIHRHQSRNQTPNQSRNQTRNQTPTHDR